VKALLTALSIIVFMAAHHTLNTEAQSQIPPSPPETRLTSLIDDIGVPLDILTAVQVEFQGHAVTKAQQITVNGQPAYQLRVDADDIPDDYDSILLIFDANWKFIEEKKTQPPQPVVIENPQPVAQNERKPTVERDDKKEEKKDQKPKPPVGGRGGDSQPRTNEENDQPGDDSPAANKPRTDTSDSDTPDPNQ